MKTKEEKLIAGREYKRKWRAANPEIDRARVKEWQKKNVEKRRIIAARYRRNQRKRNPAIRILCSLRQRIRSALSGKSKSARTERLLGIPILGYRDYLESKFLSGMSWENYGEWEIDHIRPCASFDLSDPEQQGLCFNFSNTQPLWKIDNQEKSDRV